jgi:hypothetical protein
MGKLAELGEFLRIGIDHLRMLAPKKNETPPERGFGARRSND